MVILDPYGITFDAVGVFGLVFWLFWKSFLYATYMYFFQNLFFEKSRFLFQVEIKKNC